eukprot:6327750-Amphidinium_carterae.1
MGLTPWTALRSRQRRVGRKAARGKAKAANVRTEKTMKRSQVPSEHTPAIHKSCETKVLLLTWVSEIHAYCFYCALENHGMCIYV